MKESFILQIIKIVGIGLLYMVLLILAQLGFQSLNNQNAQITVSVILAIAFPIVIYFLNIYFFRFLNCPAPQKINCSINILIKFIIGVLIALFALYLIGFISFLQTGKIKDLSFEIFKVFIFFNFLTAIGEEIIFRGTILYFFKKNNKELLGLIITALFFSLIHLINVFIGQQVTLLEIINLVLAGLLLGLVYLNFGLIAAIGTHYTWNLLFAGASFKSTFYTSEWVLAFICLILLYRIYLKKGKFESLI